MSILHPKKHSSRTAVSALAALGVVMLPVSPAHATIDNKTGGPGSNGANATYPNPGGPGGPGGGANANASSADTVNGATATGGQGGTGGAGTFSVIQQDTTAGGPGGAGGNAQATAAQTSAGSLAENDGTATGGAGGLGGSGGLFRGRRAGGGIGGNGGTATASALANSNALVATGFEVTAVTHAYGGDGGLGGLDFSSGGSGGDATASATAMSLNSDFLAATAYALGGAGGQGQGVGLSGGNGGNVLINLNPSSGSSGGGATVLVEVDAIGGVGGSGASGAAGGNGGNASVFNGVAGSTSGGLSLTQHAVGGNSGPSTGGLAAVAGSATSSLNRSLAQAPSEMGVECSALAGKGANAFGTSAAAGGNAVSTLTITAPGSGTLDARSFASYDFYNTGAGYGNGGDVTSGVGNGGAGGSSTANIIATSTGGGLVQGDARAAGGNGGIGRGSGFSGGAGGAASILLSTSTSLTGAAAMTVMANGGNGGAGLDGATGGNGAAVNLNNLANGTASLSGNVTLEQDAVGGNGGGSDGATPGLPGAATSVLTRTLNGPMGVFSAFVVGGGGGPVQNTNGVAGAIGAASITLSGSQAVFALAESRAGFGGSVTGGLSGFNGGSGADATASSITSSSGTASNSTSDASATAYAGFGGGVASTIFGSGGNGGAAFASATAMGVGPDTVEAAANATSGFGGPGSGSGFHCGNGGNATSNAVATNTQGIAHAVANATANGSFFAYNGALPGAAGAANATASATGFGTGASTATGTGSSGVATAVSRITSPGPFAFLQARGDAPVDGSARSDASANSALAAPALATGSLNQCSTYLVGQPLGGDVSTRWTLDTNVKNAFSNDTNNISVLGLTDVQYPTAGSGATHTYSTAFELNENNASLSGKNLTLGMLTTQLEGGGAGIQPGDLLRFRILKQGATVADRTFTDNPSFISYFQNTVFLLGTDNAALSGSNLDLQFLFDLTGFHPGAGVGLQFVFGSSAVAQGSTWNNSAGGPWGTPANWSNSAVPDGAGVSATFGGIITAPQIVNVDSGFTGGAMTFDNINSYTLLGNSITIATASGPGNISVNSGAHTIASSLILNADTIFTSATNSGLAVTGNLTAAGRTITKAGLGTTQFNNVRAAALNVTAGSVKISAKGTANSPAGTSILQQLLISGGANLDLSNNSMIVDYSGPIGTQVSDIRNHLKNGRLTSSSTTSTTRLGYGDNTLLHKSSFAGQSVDSSSILIKYTYAGDSDLDGDADGVDIGTWATNFTGELGGTGSMVWTQGDWDYDGDVDGVDAGLWAQAFTGELGGAGLGSLVVDDPNIAPAAATVLRSMGITVVPEPAITGVMGLLLGSILRRRRLCRGVS